MTEDANFHATDVTVDALDAIGGSSDPIEELVARAATDRSAPFTHTAMADLAKLKSRDVARFDRVRTALGESGCHLVALDAALSDQRGDSAANRSQVRKLTALAEAAAAFHAPDGTAYADFVVDGHRETWAVQSRGMSHLLTRLYYEETRGAPTSEALKSALSLVEMKARYDGVEMPVFVRVGQHGGKLYLDLVDDAWRAIEVDRTGWRVVDNPPVRFVRRPGMLPLPDPIGGGSIEQLRPFLNVQSDNDFVLAVAWLLASLRSEGPYPVMVLSGEQGSAKSTFSETLRALIDPNAAPLRPLPRDEHSLFISASNSHVLAFDNMSGLPPSLSDALCRISTGGSFSSRQLYTDHDEVLLEVSRPMILNGIEVVIDRPDLADRALLLELQPIAADRRRPETELRAAFELKHPSILGALLDALVEGQKQLPRTTLPELPRMADFALWAAACETAMWPPGTFWSAYRENRRSTAEEMVDANPVASALRSLMSNRVRWRGTATDLSKALDLAAEDGHAKSRTWSRDPQALSKSLDRSATVLKSYGIEITRKREGHDRVRMIEITRKQLRASE